MKHLTLFIAALLVSVGTMAQNVDYDFASGCGPGHTLYYKILSSNPPQAELRFGMSSVPGSDLVIPEMAADTTNTFRLYEVVSIADEAFSDYSYDEEGALVIANTVRSIGDHAFYWQGFTSLTLSESLESIGKEAFFGCSKMTGPLVIPQSVTSISEGVFKWCSFTSLDWQSQMTEIPNSIFYGCPFSGTLTLPEGLTKIGKEAFTSCQNLTGLGLPSTLNSIGYMAFAGCSSLTFIKTDAVTPPYCTGSTFSAVDTSIPVYVPFGTKPLYEADYVWGRFTNIIDDPDAVEEFENDGFEIYPNPATNAFRVTANDVEGRQAVLSVYNIVGQRMMMQKSTVNGRMVQFDVAETLPSGLYLIVLQAEETVRTGKLILNSH